MKSREAWNQVTVGSRVVLSDDLQVRGWNGVVFCSDRCGRAGMRAPVYAIVRGDGQQIFVTAKDIVSAESSTGDSQ
jgi:hypothetical protein